MKSDEIRKKFLEFFKKRGHNIIPSASLVPENDPSVLFTTAGMQPLVPFLLGEKHPLGSRLANVQKCVRTVDIDDIGDNTHATFFEMLGNWSLGDYFKEEAIPWSYELLTSKEEGFGLDPARLYITVFEGDENIPKDEESIKIWENIGIPKNRIYFRPAKDNFWSPGDNGPCGPSTEMFYDLTQDGLGDLTPEEFALADERQEVVEIWNDVFMEYKKENGQVIGKLSQKNVDTGSGLERVCAVLQGKKSIFETDLFLPIVNQIEKSEIASKEKSKRIIADHIKASCFMISDGVRPSNTGAGYVLRRLIRRVFLNFEDKNKTDVEDIIKSVLEIYGEVYKNLGQKRNEIISEINLEIDKFKKVIDKGISQFKKISQTSEKTISGNLAFDLYQTYGFPIEITEELAKENDLEVEREAFDELFKKHQESSRTSTAGMFKGGLAGQGEKETKYHTATHLLNSALKIVLGNSIKQKGSHINEERLRFDFAHGSKMSNDEIAQVEKIVNEKISEDLPVSFVEMNKDEALNSGAEGVFVDKYGDRVKVYQIGEETRGFFSRELCNGPHVSSTGRLGKFKILKEEAVASGVRRIKAVLE